MYKAHDWQSMMVKNKINFGFLLCFLLQAFSSFSQNLSQSPYTYFGLGDLQYYGSATLGNMGQVSQGLRRKYDLNIMNPASYSALAQTNIEAAGMLSNGTLQSGDSKINSSLSGLSYFNIGTTISKKGIGLAFGAAPYSALGYDIRKTTVITADTFGTLNNVNAATSQVGSGGLTRAFIGLGAKLNKNFSIGVNAGYVFGQISSKIVQTVPAEYYMFNWAADRKDDISGFIFEYGVQSHFDSINFSMPKYKTVVDSNGFEHKKMVHGTKNPISFNAGITFNMETNLNANQRYSFRTLSRGGIDYAKDSIKTDETKSGNVVIPFEIKYGIALTNNTNWTLAADFGTAAWTNYSSFGQKANPLQNSWHFNAGGCWLPDVKEDSRNYFKRLEYRLGYRFEQTNIFVNSQSVNVIGYSCGIGIPIAERDRYKKFSRVNLGFEYLTRGANTNLVNEEFFKFTIGMVFSDRWFIKYKYD